MTETTKSLLEVAKSYDYELEEVDVRPYLFKMKKNGREFLLIELSRDMYKIRADFQASKLPSSYVSVDAFGSQVKYNYAIVRPGCSEFSAFSEAHLVPGEVVEILNLNK